jgi:hypothetical protein
MRFAYADPPYLGMGESMFGYPEWDDEQRHVELVAELCSDFPDGWALSCNPRDLRWLLPVCPDDVRVCSWTKSYARIRPTSVQFMWEPLLLHGGRQVKGRRPIVRDWYCSRANQERGIAGSKPAGFCRWVLDVLGFDADQDELIDLFPGSQIMSAVAAQGVMRLP